MTTASTSDPVLTIPETAQALRVSRDTVYRLIAAGDLETCDVAPTGSRRPKTRVRRDALDSYIDRRTRKTPSLRSA